MRLLSLGLAATLAVACAPVEPSGPDAGFTKKQILHDFGGSVAYHPLEIDWRTANHTMDTLPSLAGVTVKVQDATSALAGKPPLKTVTTDADAKWFAEKVDVAVVSIAILATVEGEGLFESGFGIQRGRPNADKLDLTIWVMSDAFATHLATAVGATDVDAFKTVGFAFGQIKDLAGNPVAGAKLALFQDPTPVEFTGTETTKVHYLNDDLSAKNGEPVTGAGGVVILEDAGDTQDYTAIATGKKFENRLSGSRASSVVSFFINEVAAQ